MKPFYVFLALVVFFLAGCSQTSLSTDDEFVITQGLGVPGFDQVNDLTTDSTGVYLAGERADGSSTEGNFPYLNGYVRKYKVGSDFLNFAWDKTIGVQNRTDTTFSIAADTVGNVYVIGFNSGINPNTGFFRFATTLYKYASSGALVWKKVIASKPLDINVIDIFVSSSGEVYVLGTLAVFPNPNGELDIAVQKFSSSGTLLKTFTKRFNFFCCESVLRPLNIQVDHNGNMYVLYNEGVDDRSAGQLFINLKMFKLNPAGNALWDLAVDTGITFDAGNIVGNIADSRLGDFDLDSAGNILLAVQGGEFQFSCFNTPDPCGFLNVGYFVRKLNPSGSVLWTKRVDTGRTGADFGGTY